MNIRAIAAAVFSALVVYATATVDHDKIEPFLQPEPMSEKAAIKFKPNLSTSEIVCVSFPAVNAAGEVTGGLKATNDNSACKYVLKGSQVYERSGWYKDLWAITLGTFQKSFGQLAPKDATTGRTSLHVQVRHEVPQGNYYTATQFPEANESFSFHYHITLGTPYMSLSGVGGEFQDLIMWEQLTDIARMALNDSTNFENAEVPISDDHYEDHLDKAWPL
ncbi:hypothetical protein AM588_10008633 [Phytophthora nicotianae]|uniref:NPP1 protein n=1 Tax=Phytophthora nicotianae TaxID=4792 RepID=A0A0W8DFJ6_PHYNI|nr:hypothetical protein AM588_10008633 [Phytophthora nicotianae]